MTGDLLLDLAISLAAIIFMVLVSWLVFRERPVPVTIELASERLAFDEPDFEPIEWFIDEKGRGALVQGQAGDFTMVFRLGTDLVTRRFAKGQVRVSESQDGLSIHPDDPGVGRILLYGMGADIWARKIAGE